MLEYNEINVHARQPIDLIIYFKNTDRLYVYREDNFTLHEIPLGEGERNEPDEKMKTHSVVINEYDYTVRFYITAVSRDGSETWTHITLHTYPNLEP